MKLKDSLVTYDMDDEQIMVSVDETFSAMVRSNATAAFIVNLLQEDTTESAIVDAMAARYDAPRDVLSADVHRIVEQLRDLDALV